MLIKKSKQRIISSALILSITVTSLSLLPLKVSASADNIGNNKITQEVNNYEIRSVEKKINELSNEEKESVELVLTAVQKGIEKDNNGNYYFNESKGIEAGLDSEEAVALKKVLESELSNEEMKFIKEESGIETMAVGTISLAAIIATLKAAGLAWLVGVIAEFGIRYACRHHWDAHRLFLEFCDLMGLI